MSVHSLPGGGSAISNTMPALVNNATSKVLYDLTTTAGLNGAGGSDADRLRLVVTTGQWTNGPTGQTTYFDNVFGWGWNISNVFSPVDATKPAASIRIEDKYTQNASSPFGCEFHCAVTTLQGNERRLFSAFGPHNDSDSASSSFSHQANIASFQDYFGTPQCTFDFNQHFVFFYNSLSIYANVNNVPVARQMNAAGNSTVPLPYIDDANNLACFAPLTTIASGGNASGITSTTRGTNSQAFTANAPGATSSNIFINCGSGGSLKTATFGVDSGGSLVLAQASSTGSMYFDHNSTINFRDRNNGYAVSMKLSSGTLTVQGPVVPNKDYTVATLPAANSTIKGARAHVTDATTPTFLGTLTGGGTVVCPVFCNGTAWVAG